MKSKVRSLLLHRTKEGSRIYRFWNLDPVHLQDGTSFIVKDWAGKEGGYVQKEDPIIYMKYGVTKSFMARSIAILR